MKKLIPALLAVALLVTGAAFAVPAAGQTAEEEPDFAAATPAVDALVTCMMERGYACRPAEDDFFWASLYYMLGIYGEEDTRAEVTGDTVSFPSEVVRDYAASLFTDYADLPEIPESLRGSIDYDAQSDTYVLARGSAGLSETVLGEGVPCGENSYLVSGQVVDLEDESVVCNFEVVLTASDTMFPYTVTDLLIL
jgi:hypothetical protein